MIGKISALSDLRIIPLFKIPANWTSMCSVEKIIRYREWRRQKTKMKILRKSSSKSSKWNKIHTDRDARVEKQGRQRISRGFSSLNSIFIFLSYPENSRKNHAHSSLQRTLQLSLIGGYEVSMYWRRRCPRTRERERIEESARQERTGSWDGRKTPYRFYLVRLSVAVSLFKPVSFLSLSLYSTVQLVMGIPKERERKREENPFLNCSTNPTEEKKKGGSMASEVLFYCALDIKFKCHRWKSVYERLRLMSYI